MRAATPKAIWKIGAITSKADVSADRVAELRENHLFCLRFNGDPNFGNV